MAVARTITIPDSDLPVDLGMPHRFHRHSGASKWALFVLWSCWKKRPSLRAAAVGGLLAVVMLIPQAIRSQIELGFIAPFGNPWLTKIQHRSGTRLTYLYFRDHGHPDVIQTYHFGSAYPLGAEASGAV